LDLNAADLREECVLKGFRDFVLRGNIVELAVAVVMAIAFNDLVRAFTNDIINPVLGKIFGKPDFSAFHPGGIGIGSFINALIAFLLVALAVYWTSGVAGARYPSSRSQRTFSCSGRSATLSFVPTAADRGPISVEVVRWLLGEDPFDIVPRERLAPRLIGLV
jgi:large-conductance mechanosensitive channel